MCSINCEPVFESMKNIKKYIFNFSSLWLASMSLPTPFKLKAIHALSYLKLFYVDSVLLYKMS